MIRPLLLLVALGLAGEAAELRIQVAGPDGKPLWTRLEVRDAEGGLHQPKNGLMDRTARNREGGKPYYLGSFVVQGAARLEVPAGRYTVVAEHGLEYERGVAEAVVAEDAPAEVALTLSPWIAMNDRGWWSADMHLHRPPEDTPTLALAEDLNLSVAFTMWNKRNLWEQGLALDPVHHISNRQVATLMNAEDERGGGAWMLHGLTEPLPLAVDGRWFPAGIEFVRMARQRKPPGGLFPWFDCEKPIWWEVPVMMALEPPDSFGVLHNHFNQYGIHAEEAWGRPRDRALYPGWQGFVNYSLEVYYRYLNLGFRLPPSAGSASGVLPNPPGYNRVYVKLDEPFSVEAFYRGLRDHRAFVTNGPMLFLETSEQDGVVFLQAEALAREPIDRLEVVANGRVIHTERAQPGATSIELDYRLPATDYSWAAVRCFLRLEESVRLAHSAPVYLKGTWDGREDARYFHAWVEELIGLTASEPDRFPNSTERDQILALYRKAREFYASRLR